MDNRANTEAEYSSRSNEEGDDGAVDDILIKTDSGNTNAEH